MCLLSTDRLTSYFSHFFLIVSFFSRMHATRSSYEKAVCPAV